MSGEYFEVKGKETGEAYASGMVLVDNPIEAAYLLNYLYDQAVGIQQLRQMDERLCVEALAVDPMDEDVSESDGDLARNWRNLAVRLAAGILRAYVSPSSHRA